VFHRLHQPLGSLPLAQVLQHHRGGPEGSDRVGDALAGDVEGGAMDGLKAAIRRVFGASWQRCRVHWMRNALAYVSKTQQSMVAAALRQAFLQPDRAQASQMLRHVADHLRPKWPKLAALINDSETDVLSYLDFPEPHRSKLHSTNPLERPNKEVKRRADVIGIFPNEAAIIRLIGAVLLEQNDEWQLQHRYMQVEVMAELASPASPADPQQIPCAA
jgi:transposase-like protein